MGSRPSPPPAPMTWFQCRRVGVPREAQGVEPGEGEGAVPRDPEEGDRDGGEAEGERHTFQAPLHKLLVAGGRHQRHLRGGRVRRWACGEQISETNRSKNCVELKLGDSYKIVTEKLYHFALKTICGHTTGPGCKIFSGARRST